MAKASPGVDGDLDLLAGVVVREERDVDLLARAPGGRRHLAARIGHQHARRAEGRLGGHEQVSRPPLEPPRDDGVGRQRVVGADLDPLDEAAAAGALQLEHVVGGPGDGDGGVVGRVGELARAVEVDVDVLRGRAEREGAGHLRDLGARTLPGDGPGLAAGVRRMPERQRPLGRRWFLAGRGQGGRERRRRDRRGRSRAHHRGRAGDRGGRQLDPRVPDDGGGAGRDDAGDGERGRGLPEASATLEAPERGGHRRVGRIERQHAVPQLHRLALRRPPRRCASAEAVNPGRQARRQRRLVGGRIGEVAAQLGAHVGEPRLARGRRAGPSAIGPTSG